MVENKRYQNAWWLIFINVILLIVGSYISSYFDTKIDEFSLMIALESLVLVPVIIGFFMIRDDKDISFKEKIGIRGFSAKLIPFLLLLPICGQYFFSGCMAYIQAILQILFGTVQTDAMIPNNIVQLIQILFCTCILAPIVEELLCRGIMMHLLSKYSFAVELICSSIAFALLHFSIQSFIPIFFVGLLLGLVKKSTGSIFACIIMHAANNLFAISSLILIDRQIVPEVMSIVVVVLLIVVFPALFVGYIKNINKTNWRDYLILEKKKIGVSVAMILSVVAFVGFHALILISRINSGEIIESLNSLITFG